MLATPKNILILTADTGGGHDAAAAALKQGLNQIAGSRARVVIADPLRDGAPWPSCRLGAIHSWMGRRGLWLMRLMFWADRQSLVRELLYYLWYPVVAASLRRTLAAERPDLIVSVQPHLTQLLLILIQRSHHSAPVAIVPTDLVRIPWACFHRRADLCLVATEPARTQALRAGLEPARVKVTGLPIDLRFADQDRPGRPALKERLGLDPHLPLVLLIGGGGGYGGPLEEIAEELNHLCGIQLVVATGRNASLYDRLSVMQWQIPTRILGFVDPFCDWILAADVLLTKAGPGALAEAFAAGLAVIMFGHFPGPEAACADYVVEHGAGTLVPDPRQIVHHLRSWLQPDRPELKRMASASLSLGRPDAARVAAQELWKLANSKESVTCKVS